jgi:tungstate transport system substrate-binding protein
MRLMRLVLLAATLALAGSLSARAGTVTIAATTSLQDSGLFAYLLPKYAALTGTKIDVVSRASAQALLVAEHDGADLVVVNEPDALTRFVDQRHGVYRRRLMANDFLIAGPRSDPAKVARTKDGAAALRAIAQARAPYVSRADNSGTNAKEQKLWARAGINPKARTGNWLRETGLGMGDTLEIADKLGAYILTDRATFAARRSRLKLDVLVEGDPDFYNPYEIVMVSPLRHPRGNAEEAKALLDWLTGKEGQAAIGDFKVDGMVLFHPSVE